MQKQNDQATERALAALDSMATVWAAKVGLREAVRAILATSDREDRLVAFIKQAHAEGLYEGRTSLQ